MDLVIEIIDEKYSFFEWTCSMKELPTPTAQLRAVNAFLITLQSVYWSLKLDHWTNTIDNTRVVLGFVSRFR